MSLSIENPFANYGVIVSKDRFIGRKDDLKAIENRTIIPIEPGNLAIVGPPRIGKSSLAYHAIMERKKKLLQKKNLPIWINLAMYDDPKDFFLSLVSICLEEINQQQNWLNTHIQEAAENCLQQSIPWSQNYRQILSFFKKIKDAKIRILFILDEFDHARKLFKGDTTSGFRGLRELAYGPEWRVTFITTSRRTIHKIELETHSISNFNQLFMQLNLNMFNDDELEEYFARLATVGIPVEPTFKTKFDFYAGGHPYLLDMLGYEVVEIFREQGQIDIDIASHRREESFIYYYDQIIDLLREDERFNKLLQILFGPVINIKKTDITAFFDYGLIKYNPQWISDSNNATTAYVAFSDHFQWYLEQIGRSVDVWPLLGETERALRKIVESEMQKRYGNKWLESYADIYKACLNTQKKDTLVVKSDNLLDYTYIGGLFSIIFNNKNWQIFKPIFGTKPPKDELRYWKQRGDITAKVRNPLAHHRPEVVSASERLQTEGFCHEILEAIAQTDSRHAGSSALLMKNICS